MAKSIPYEVPRRDHRETAEDELNRLLQSLHEQGVLRLINDLVVAYPQVSEILMRGLNQEESRNAVQNLCLLGTALGRIPPERFDRLLEAVSVGVARSESALEKGESQSPGLFGAFRLLQDGALWSAINPILGGFRAFSAAMRSPLRKPAERRHEAREK